MMLYFEVGSHHPNLFVRESLNLYGDGQANSIFTTGIAVLSPY
jgi:hypothetical protein